MTFLKGCIPEILNPVILLSLGYLPKDVLDTQFRICLNIAAKLISTPCNGIPGTATDSTAHPPPLTELDSQEMRTTSRR
jgi:hypothetical protein